MSISELNASVIIIPNKPPCAGTIEHLNKILLASGDTFGARFKSITIDEESEFWSVNKNELDSQTLSIMRVEGNVFTFQSGNSSTRYTLPPCEVCIIAYTDLISEKSFYLNKETKKYELN